ncbi:MAG: 4Fe-4S dicluster domain-containing protein [Candidatus Lokiarchaeota archaeon]|nr:4Fe-4S dicluster domain-containing protein [Candidatus Lokiarchaeota archaeon]
MNSIKNKISTKLNKFLKKNPRIGNLFATLMGAVEVTFLEILNFISNHIFPNFKIIVLRKLQGLWGGRVVPLNINIPVETKYLPHQEILNIISRSHVFTIGYCYCRKKHHNCDNPIYTCIGLGVPPGQTLYTIDSKKEFFKEVSKEEIIQLLNDCDDRGLVHQLIYFPDPNFYYVICNCCTCCCETLNNYKKFLSPEIIKSDFIEITDNKKCINCGTCINICPFDARKYDSNNKLVVNRERCFGCGICIRKCPESAIKLIKK